MIGSTLLNERSRQLQQAQAQTQRQNQTSIPIHFSPLAQTAPRSLSPEEQLARMTLLDELMDDIGMGKFQMQLLVLCGLGWFADNVSSNGKK
ncbi:hypothetical protein BCR41DRAFT_344282 [Lobosporangium transversale]|uniref:Uncharacterized protein n=1 Tax=Lobosporangium transversale TaxID=64571 RepID=A0A1Y2H7A0_9FUNG|nr:hypothetical protein BCR41DRAFT_344282 [Lobosporangium transversale]ORZ28922.1 hypothetical protein BCR41DRAFT_344282 [Lobosporangium transversale]|eukprot:XP_021886595.1 hypothetical protein BCR41DRAFT_344282 [Lobosporangium transversale]